MPDRSYSDQELDAALASISAPGRLSQAQEVVLRTVPSLQRLLATVLAEGGWFDSGHAQAVRAAAGAEDRSDREREVQTLVAEETRLGMMVGVAIGFELARELDRTRVGGDTPREHDGPGAGGDQDPPDEHETGATVQVPPHGHETGATVQAPPHEHETTHKED